jgi:subtilisin family serine protease
MLVVALLGAASLVAAVTWAAPRATDDPAPTEVAALPILSGGELLHSPPSLAPEPETPTETPQRSEFVRKQMVLNFASGTSASERSRALARLRVRAIRDVAGGGVLVGVSRGDRVAEIARRAKNIAAVRYAEPNFIYRAADLLPNDPRISALWGLENSGQNINGSTGSLDADIDAAAAWVFETGSPDVIVAVVDSGVAYGHPDLAANMWSNAQESGAAASDGIDNDGNGLVDDRRGWDWVSNDNDPNDLNGHGSHVAGTIGARGNDATGVTGVNWEVRLMALRALDASGNGTSADVADAMAYAVSKGARVVNLSLGGPDLSIAIRDVITSSPQTLFVIAAGNSSSNNDAVPHYPCNLTATNTICVAASGQRDDLASFSNYGSTNVDLAAPGVNILSTVPATDGSYGLAYYNGTSMATPQVAGAAALLWAAQPGATVTKIRDALLGGVETKPAFTGKVATGGRLNVMSSLTRLTGLVPGASTTTTATTTTVPATTTTGPATTVAPATVAPATTTATGASPTTTFVPTTTTTFAAPSTTTTEVAPTAGATERPRSISLRRPKPKVARGMVVAEAGSAACKSRVPVKILRNGRKVGRVTTDAFGRYRTTLPSRRGRYVALAPPLEPAADTICRRARSDRPTPVGTEPGSDPSDPVGTTDPSDPGSGTTDPSGPGTPGDTSSTCWTWDPEELDFATRMNDERAALGREGMTLDPELSRVAREHTQEMVGQNTLNHTSGTDLARRVTNWEILGENVGVGGSVTTLHAAFMASTAHRENILLPAFTHFGVGVQRTPEKMWVTVIFQSSEDPGTTLPMPSC